MRQPVTLSCFSRLKAFDIVRFHTGSFTIRRLTDRLHYDIACTRQVAIGSQIKVAPSRRPPPLYFLDDGFVGRAYSKSREWAGLELGGAAKQWLTKRARSRSASSSSPSSSPSPTGVRSR